MDKLYRLYYDLADNHNGTYRIQRTYSTLAVNIYAIQICVLNLVLLFWTCYVISSIL
jgi:hypothetical protein